MCLKELSAARALFALSPAGIVYKTAPGRYLEPGLARSFPRNKRDRVTPFVYIKRILFVLHSCILLFKARVFVNVFALPLSLFFFLFD